MSGLLWGLIVILVIAWLLGFSVYHVAGFAIHLLLIAAVVLLVVNLLTGRGARV